MAQFGWVLMFSKRAEGVEQLPTREAKAKAMREHNQRCFEQLEPLLIDGLRLASKQELIGSACVVGSEAACLRLKEQVEAMGLATMIPNTDCIRPA